MFGVYMDTLLRTGIISSTRATRCDGWSRILAGPGEAAHAWA
jgi:hypothetical protein